MADGIGPKNFWLRPWALRSAPLLRIVRNATCVVFFFPRGRLTPDAAERVDRRRWQTGGQVRIGWTHGGGNGLDLAAPQELASRKGKTVVVAFDEFQQIVDYDDDLTER